MVKSNTNRQSLVLFRVEDQRYALSLDAVERVILAVAVTPVPETPAFVLGLVNLTGQLLPVVSFRRCLGLPDRAIQPKDQFVIARTPRLTMALVVDEVQGLSELDVSRTVAPDGVLPGRECRVNGLVKIEGDIILIYDLKRLLSHEDQDRILQVKTPAETNVS